MVKKKLIILLLIVLSISKVHTEDNLTIHQIESARTLLKEYAFMSCLGEGFTQKLHKNNNINKVGHKKLNDNNSINKVLHIDNIFRKDLVLSTFALRNNVVYYIEDNTKHTTAKNLAVYHKVDQFVKKNYSKVKGINTPLKGINIPFVMNLRSNGEKIVLLTCFDMYNSKELNKLIREQDKYINDCSILNDIIVINDEINSTQTK